MRTKIIHFFVAVMGFLALCSCDKSGLSPNDGKVSSSSIKFGKVQVSFPADTKADSSGPRKVGEVNDGDVSFSVEETVSSIGGYQTKAAATTTASLGGFNVEGFLDPEIQQKEGADDADKNNLHFIQNAPVTGGYQGPLWIGDFNGEYKWRFGTHHHFWATPNNLSNLTIDNPFTSASFSYTSSGDEDVILAYTNRYYGKDEDSDNKDAKLHLDFKHALSAVKINSDNLVFKKRKSGEADELAGNYPSGSSTPRCEITKYEVRGMMNTGDCQYDGSAFSWSNLSSSVNPAVVNLLADNEPQFLVPQDRSGAILHLEMIDRQRQVTRPFIYELEDVFGTSEWLAGYQYNYKLKGTIVVPKLPEGQEGIDAGFQGKAFQSIALLEGLAGKYIKKVRLTWNGLPGGNAGNGTFVWVSLEDSNYTPSESDYMGSGQQPITTRPQVGFVYNYKSGTCLKGNVNGTTCSCDIPIAEDADELNLYAVYIGSNNSGTCNWYLHNLKFEVIEWR